MTDYTHHYCKTVEVAATAPALFAELDHHERLADHMMQSSAMMAGQRMRFEFDRDRGRRIGSKITMVGHMLGLDLIVEEVVLDRDPPRTKTWETVGNPQLLVIGSYRMGFTIEPRGPASRLTVFIDYRLRAVCCRSSGGCLVRSMLGGASTAWWMGQPFGPHLQAVRFPQRLQRVEPDRARTAMKSLNATNVRQAFVGLA